MTELPNGMIDNYKVELNSCHHISVYFNLISIGVASLLGTFDRDCCTIDANILKLEHCLKLLHHGTSLVSLVNN